MDKEDIRARIWAECWMRVANASNCTRSDAPTSWADAMLSAFDARFPQYTAKPEDSE